MNIFMALWDTQVWPAQWGVITGASLLAAIWDVKTRRIPNLLTGPLFLGGLVFSFAVARWAGLADSLAGAAVASLPFILMFIFAGGGAGDAKMMMGIGAWLGFYLGAMVAASVVIVGGIMAVIYAAGTGRLGSLFHHLGYFCFILFSLGRGKWSKYEGVLPRNEEMVSMPYGPAICLGTILVGIGRVLWRM